MSDLFSARYRRRQTFLSCHECGQGLAWLTQASRTSAHLLLRSRAATRIHRVVSGIEFWKYFHIVLAHVRSASRREQGQDPNKRLELKGLKEFNLLGNACETQELEGSI